jgi:hypothetical protein
MIDATGTQQPAARTAGETTIAVGARRRTRTGHVEQPIRPDAPAGPASADLRGARCAVHTDRAAVSICTRCGDYLCPECGRATPDGRTFCVRCRKNRYYIPFEDRGLGLWRGYWKTLWRSIAEPLRFADELPVTGNWFFPIAYTMVPTALLFLLFGSLMGLIMGFVMGQAAGDNAATPWDLGAYGFAALMGAVYFFMGLVMYVIHIFGWSLVLWGSTLLFGARGLSYGGVFRIVCYTGGANWLVVVPFIGALAVLLYYVVLGILCLSAKTGVSGGRATAIYLVPLLATFVLLFGLQILFILIAAGLSG